MNDKEALMNLPESSPYCVEGDYASYCTVTLPNIKTKINQLKFGVVWGTRWLRERD